MINDINIENTKNGVGISIKGDIKFSDVEKLTQSCNSGQCDCLPQMLEKIDTISASGIDGNVNISLSSNNLDASEVQSCMSSCECGF